MTQVDKVVVGTLDSHEFQLKPRVANPSRFVNASSRFIDATNDITDRDRVMARYYELKLKVKQKDLEISQEFRNEAVHFFKGVGVAVAIIVTTFVLIGWVLLR